MVTTRDPRYGDTWTLYEGKFKTNRTIDLDTEEIHNLMPLCIARLSVDLVTMCGLRIPDAWEPYQDMGPTTCDRCGLAAAYWLAG